MFAGCRDVSDDECSERIEHHVETALALDTMLPEAHAAKTFWSVQEGRFNDARAHYSRALDKNPNYAAVHVWMANGGLFDNPAEAFKAYEKAALLDPVSPLTNNAYILSLISRGELDEAKKRVEQYAVIDPTGAIVFRGAISSFGGHESEYVLAALEALGVGGDALTYRWAVADTLAMSLAGISLEGESLRMESNDQVTILSWSGNPEAAIELGRKLLSEHPNDGLTQVQLNLALAHAGHCDEARPFFEKGWQVIATGDSTSCRKGWQQGTGSRRRRLFKSQCTRTPDLPPSWNNSVSGSPVSARKYCDLPVPTTIPTGMSGSPRRKPASNTSTPHPADSAFFAVAARLGDDTAFSRGPGTIILRRVIEHFRNQQWTAVALDFVIVVVGVFVGLQVDNWNQERADSRRESFYLAALRDDFEVVVAELEHDVAHYEEIANSMTLLIDESRKAAPDASLDALNEAARQLIVMEGTPIVSDTYSNLTGSGDLAIISSQELKNRMSSFFGTAQVVELVANTHEMQLVGIFQPYIIEHLDYTAMFLEDRNFPFSAPDRPDRVLEALPTAEFRNVAAVKWDIVTDLRGQLLIALDEARAVESLLAEELEKTK